MLIPPQSNVLTPQLKPILISPSPTTLTFGATHGTVPEPPVVAPRKSQKDFHPRGLSSFAGGARHASGESIQKSENHAQEEPDDQTVTEPPGELRFPAERRVAVVPIAPLPDVLPEG